VDLAQRLVLAARYLRPPNVIVAEQDQVLQL
jgi:hypothetical protein